jgi:hypothetical protein
MAGRSDLGALIDKLAASAAARERTEMILSTLGRQRSVEEACIRLGIGRTRFQDLRRRLLQAAVEALEERAAGRPRLARGPDDPERKALQGRVDELEGEVSRLKIELELARSAAGPAVARRRRAKELIR